MLVSCTQPSGIFNGRDSATAVHKIFFLVRQPTPDFAARPEFRSMRALFSVCQQVPPTKRSFSTNSDSLFHNFTIILTFWPFRKLEIISTALLLRNVCAEAADAIGTLVKSTTDYTHYKARPHLCHALC